MYRIIIRHRSARSFRLLSRPSFDRSHDHGPCYAVPLFFAEREDANSVVLIPRFFASSSHCLFLSVRRDSFMAPFCFALLFCLDHTLGFGSVIFPTPLAHAILFALFLPPCLTFLAPLHQLRQSLASSSSHVLIIIHTYKHTHKYIRTHSCEPLTVINSILHHCICASMAARQVHEA